MPTPTIRGHSGLFKAIQDGSEIVIDSITRVDINQDSSFQRSFFVGNPVGEGDQTVEGWSGTVEMEVRNATVEDFIDGLVNNNLNGIGISDYTFLTTEKYPDGTSRSYVYFDVQWKLSRSQSGLNEKVTKRLDFQASGRIPL